PGGPRPTLPRWHEAKVRSVLCEGFGLRTDSHWDHHGWERAVGSPPRPPREPRPPRRRARDQGGPPGVRGPGRQGAFRLRLLDRELVASAHGSTGADEALS